VTIDEAVERIQLAYPQVYYACHTRHERKRSNPHHLSHRDGDILVHLDIASPVSLSALARHLDLSLSTLSEAISRLAAHGYVAKAAGGGRDRRRVGLTLTAKGWDAVRAGSVLEARRLRTVLARLNDRQRASVVAGLTRLARACRTPGTTAARSRRRRS
jgi:DNA-binding MarR family transcriptional regulator